MKRLIKFRGKRVNGGEWIESMTISYGTVERKTNCVFLEIAEGNWQGVLPDTVGQFIGLLDKNKREVYDGDIIKDSEGRIGQVCWDDEFLQWLIMYGDDNVERCMIGFSCEVIGNVFDNPELLKGGEE